MLRRNNDGRVRRRPLRTFLIVLMAVLLIGAAWLLRTVRKLPAPTIDAALLADAPYDPPVWVGSLASSRITEASGFARSLRDPDRIWVINDSGNPPVLHAIGLDGADHGAVPVRGLENDDWEDLASLSWDGVPYLLVADTGDNLARKPQRALHAVVEPAFATGAAPTGVDVAWTMAFRFEDGPRDCEAVAIDPASGEILLLSKRDVPARLYSLAWPDDELSATGAPQVARFVTEVFNIPQPTGAEGVGLFPFRAWLAQPTSMAIAPAGDAAVVLTYGAAYRFVREPGTDWQAAFRGLPGLVRMPAVRGAEALGFAPDGRSVFVSTEGRPAPLYRYDAAGR